MNLIYIIRLIIFLTINFAALGIGGIFTGKGVPSQWYQNLSKAPWTPPGWVFGAAWTTIMVLFAIYMTYAWENIAKRNILILLFAIQWILNVAWNPVFFHFHNVAAGALLIVLLLIVITIFQFDYYSQMNFKSYLVTPYLLWLLIAGSLNIYILIAN